MTRGWRNPWGVGSRKEENNWIESHLLYLSPTPVRAVARVVADVIEGERGCETLHVRMVQAPPLVDVNKKIIQRENELVGRSFAFRKTAQ